MIVVYTLGGERIQCEDATRYRTDEHNNLEVTGGTQHQPTPVACFNENHWERVVIEDDGPD